MIQKEKPMEGQMCEQINVCTVSFKNRFDMPNMCENYISSF